MPPSELSKEEEATVNAIVERKLRYQAVGDEHAEVVRRKGREVFARAYSEACKALGPQHIPEMVCLPKDTTMEEYYESLEHLLTAIARKPWEHIYITLMAASLIAVVDACEYIYLPERLRREIDVRMAQRELERKAASTAPPPKAKVAPRRLPTLRPVSDPRAKHTQLSDKDVDEYLKNFSRLHHRILWDADSCEYYKIVGVKYSQVVRAIESFEVQFQQCTSAIAYSFDDVKEMLLRSSKVTAG